MDKHTITYYRAILNTMPLMIFLMDSDMRIQYFNEAATGAFALDVDATLNKRSGEGLHCLHASDVPQGCGSGPFCKSCVIRNSVTASLRGHGVTRKRTKLELNKDSAGRKLEVLITASPMPFESEPLVLLVIEDISEISALRDIIPICSHCKKIRDDQQYWHTVESYFNSYRGLDFTHGICPTCMEQLYPDYVRQKKRSESNSAT